MPWYAWLMICGQALGVVTITRNNELPTSTVVTVLIIGLLYIWGIVALAT